MVRAGTPGRLLGLDVGDARIGTAVCDASHVVVTPQGVIRRHPEPRALEQILRLIADEEIVGVVVGLPLSLNGEHSDQTRAVAEYVAQLVSQLPVPVTTSDERYTTVEAERWLREHGVKRDQWRARIDSIAATIILQDFLDAHLPPHLASQE